MHARRAVLLAIAVCGSLMARPGGVVAAGSTSPPFQAGVVVAKLTAGQYLQAVESREHLRLVAQLPDSITYEFAITDGRSVPQVVAAARSNPDIATIQPDYVLSDPGAMSLVAQPKSISADPKSLSAGASYVAQMYRQQWMVPWIRLPGAQAVTPGAHITVAVLDTGVQTNHPALAGHVVTGYDFVSGTAVVTDPAGGVDSGHGTFVAGLVALCAPAARIMPIRVLGPNGQGDAATVVRGIAYAVDHGANIINLSFGASVDDAAIDEAIRRAQQHNVVVVAAVGNDDTATPEYPAAIPGVIGVAATDGRDVKAWFSNYGRYVSLSAPGTNLYSTYDNSGYAFGAGTSFATPIASGVAALAWSLQPSDVARDVRGLLEESSVSIEALNPGYADKLGSGRVDATAAVTESAND